MADDANSFEPSNYVLGALIGAALLLVVAGATSGPVWIFLVVMCSAVGGAAYLNTRG